MSTGMSAITPPPQQKIKSRMCPDALINWTATGPQLFLSFATSWTYFTASESSNAVQPVAANCPALQTSTLNTSPVQTAPAQRSQILASVLDTRVVPKLGFRTPPVVHGIRLIDGIIQFN